MPLTQFHIHWCNYLKQCSDVAYLIVTAPIRSSSNHASPLNHGSPPCRILQVYMNDRISCRPTPYSHSSQPRSAIIASPPPNIPTINLNKPAVLFPQVPEGESEQLGKMMEDAHALRRLYPQQRKKIAEVRDTLGDLKKEAKKEIGVRMKRARVRWRKADAACERLIAARDAGAEVNAEDVATAEMVLATGGIRHRW
jgi:hypothetical protein